jgi:tetratricopeptide (TPR) repeat protein
MKKISLILFLVVVVGIFFKSRENKPRDEKPKEITAEQKVEISVPKASESVSIPERPQVPISKQKPENSQDTSSAEEQARKLFEQGNARQAVALLEKELEAHPSSEKALLDLGFILLESGQSPEKSEMLFKKVLEVNPDNVVALSELLNRYAAQGKYADGNELLDTVQAKSSEQAQVAAQRAAFLLQQGRPTEAAVNFQAASGDTKMQKAALSGLGASYMQAGDFPRAIEAYQKLVSAIETQPLSPPSSKAHKTELVGGQLDLTMAYIQNGNTQEAEKLISQIEKDAPSHPGLSELKKSLQKAKAL